MRRVGTPRAIGGLHEIHPAQAAHLPAHDPRHRQPLDRADGGEEQDDVELAAQRDAVAEDGVQHAVDPVPGLVVVEEHAQQDDEDRERQRVDDVHDAHHERVHVAAVVTRNRAVNDADDQRDDGRHDADGQGDAPAEEDAREEVAPERVRAEPVGGAGRRFVEVEVLGVGRGGDDAREDAQQRDNDDHDPADDGELVLEQTVPGVLPEAAARFRLGGDDRRGRVVRGDPGDFFGFEHGKIKGSAAAVLFALRQITERRVFRPQGGWFFG